MTTSNSPPHEIKAEADRIAGHLKAIERGDKVPAIDPHGKLAEARRNKAVVSLGIAMDDKLISIEISWALIRATSRTALSEWIVAQMSGTTMQ